MFVLYEVMCTVEMEHNPYGLARRVTAHMKIWFVQNLSSLSMMGSICYDFHSYAVIIVDNLYSGAETVGWVIYFLLIYFTDMPTALPAPHLVAHIGKLSDETHIAIGI
jgi:hypothetical protein